MAGILRHCCVYREVFIKFIDIYWMEAVEARVGRRRSARNLQKIEQQSIEVFLPRINEPLLSLDPRKSA